MKTPRSTPVQDFETAQAGRAKLPTSAPATPSSSSTSRSRRQPRTRAYEGVVIGKKNAGPELAFTVRKISHGFGVERVFQTHSATIDLGAGQAPRRRACQQAVLPAAIPPPPRASSEKAPGSRKTRRQEGSPNPAIKACCRQYWRRNLSE